MHWFVCNDAKRDIGGVNLGGSALRRGRFFLYGSNCPRLKLEWSFWNTLNWLETYMRFDGEDSMVSVGLILPRLACLSAGIGVPSRWLSWWMIKDRVFAMKVGYVSSILRLSIAHADWAEDCGMTDYYRKQTPRKYTNLQLWPGWECALRFPPVLRWVFGKERREKAILDTRPIIVEMDGERYEGTWQLEHWWTERARWPWRYGVSVSSYLDMPHPPQFSGKGENSWDCGDDGIYGMGSRATTPGAAIGEYISAVLKNRERYGQPSSART